MKSAAVISIILISVTLQVSGEAAQILKQSYFISDVRHISMQITMTIHARNGIKNRTLNVSMVREQDVVKIFMHIIQPAFLHNMKFLTHHYSDGREDTWLKTSRGVRQLSDAHSTEKIFDSDFTVEDFSEIDLSDYSLEHFFTQEVDDYPCHFIQMTPLLASGDYLRKVVKVDVASHILRGIDFLSTQDENVRTYTLDETQTIRGHLFPLQCTMETLNRSTKTVLRFQRIDIQSKIPARIFNRGNL